MPQVFWDASALAKRYYREIGTETVNAIFAEVVVDNMATTFLERVKKVGKRPPSPPQAAPLALRRRPP